MINKCNRELSHELIDVFFIYLLKLLICNTSLHSDESRPQVEIMLNMYVCMYVCMRYSNTEHRVN